MVVDDALMAGALQPAHDVRTHPPESDHAELHHEPPVLPAASAMSAAPTMPARFPSSAIRTSHPGLRRSENWSACFTIAATDHDELRPEHGVELRQVLVEPLGPLLPRELLRRACRVGDPGVGELAFDLEVPELGVGDEHAVVEQRGADTGPDGHEEHHASAAARRAEARLGHAGRVGVVQHRALMPGRAPDHRRRVRADPRRVDVRGGAHGSAHHDGRQRAPDRTGVAELLDEGRDHFGDRVGRGRLGVSMPDAAGRRSGDDVDVRGLDAGSADVDTDEGVGSGGRIRRSRRHRTRR